MGRPPREEALNLTIKILPSTKKRLELLQEQSEASSLTEVIRKSLAAYDLLLQGIARGDEIILRDKKGKETKVVLT